MIILDFVVKEHILQKHPDWNFSWILSSLAMYFFDSQKPEAPFKRSFSHPLILTYQDVPSDQMILANPKIAYIYCDSREEKRFIGIALSKMDKDSTILRWEIATDDELFASILEKLRHPTKTQTLTPAEQNYIYDFCIPKARDEKLNLLTSFRCSPTIKGKHLPTEPMLQAFTMHFISHFRCTPYGEIFQMINCRRIQEPNDNLLDSLDSFDFLSRPHHRSYALLADAINLEAALKTAGIRVPNRFICKIGNKLMTHATYAEKNPRVFYEAHALLNWLVTHELTDPSTGTTVELQALICLPEHHRAITSFLSAFIRDADLKKYLDQDDENAIRTALKEKHKAASALEEKNSAPAAIASPLQKQGVFSQHPIVPNSIPDIAPTVLEEHLRIAAANGNIDMVRSLIEQRVNINARDPESGLSALLCARRNNQAECERLLLESEGIEEESSHALAI